MHSQSVSMEQVDGGRAHVVLSSETILLHNVQCVLYVCARVRVSVSLALNTILALFATAGGNERRNVTLTHSLANLLDRLWGAQTQRSLENFPIGGPSARMPIEIIKVCMCMSLGPRGLNCHCRCGSARVRQ